MNNITYLNGECVNLTETTVDKNHLYSAVSEGKSK